MNLDEDLQQTMNSCLTEAKTLLHNYTDDQLKMLIVSQNLRALADVLLALDDKGRQLDSKKVALGLIATAEWLDPEEVNA